MDTNSSQIKRTGVRGPHRWHDDAFKLMVVEQSLILDNSASKVARLHNVNVNQVFNWRKQYLSGSLTLVKARSAKPVQLLPVMLNEPVVAAVDSGMSDIIELVSGCSCCDKIVQVDAPSRPVARGIAAPGLLAHILVAKYADHLPLYRQSVIYAREGVELSRSFLADQVGAASTLLRPLVDAVRRHVFAATRLHADDTPISVLAPGNGKTKTARLWTYVRDDQPAGSTDPAAVWFAYTPDRKGIHPQTHLASFTGTLQADAYAGFNAVYESGRIQEAACWAHARRKFYDLHKARPSAITAEALKRIGELYKIEEAIRGQQPEERRKIRQEQSAPFIDDMERWFQQVQSGLSRKSDTTAAINYALNLWPALKRYASDGNIEIDNSAAERSSRWAGRTICLSALTAAANVLPPSIL